MANHSPRPSNTVTKCDQRIARFRLGTPIPLLDEIDEDYDATWPSWHDSGHSMGDWESTSDEIRVCVE